jgi:nucleotide-binding universal stress UspA family protein
MNEIKRIVLALDGSALAQRALPYAATLAGKAGARLLLVRAALAQPLFQDDLAAAQIAAIAAAEADLEAAATPLRAEGLSVETRVCYGPAAPAIVEEARLSHADLIVLSTHGRGGVGRWIYGSVADRVLREAETPVLIVPPAADAGWFASGEARVLVPVDGSALAEEALRPAAALAAALEGTLLLVRVVEPLYYGYLYGQPYPPAPDVDLAQMLTAAASDLDALAGRLRAEGHRVATRAEVGPAARTIARIAGEEGVAAIAMATHGRGGLARLVMGSVATGLLQRADVPVLLVHPTPVARLAAAPPQAPAHPRAGEPRTAAALELTAEEQRMVEYGLELLLSSTDRDPSLTGPIAELIARVERATPIRRDVTAAGTPSNT